MDIFYIATGLAIFVSVALMIEGLYLWWNAKYGAQAVRIARRLRGMTAPTQCALEERVFWKTARSGDQTAVQRLLQETALDDRLGRLLAQSGSRLTAARFILISAAIAGAALLALLLAGMPAVIAGAAAVFAAVVPLLWTIRKKARRLARIEQQLPEALDLMSRALRAGHALPSAIKMVSDEIADPLGGEFRTVFNEVNFGVPMQDALNNLATRIPGSDIGFFAVAVLIQRQSGGNLSELLDTIARIVRERLKLFTQVQVYSAEGRLSAWILGVLPFALGGVLYLVNPDFMRTLWVDPSGMRMLGAVLVLMVVGIAWMRRVIRIRV
jgi:tight adherence protein B